jgi:PAS domain S-box-containing protein
MNLRKLTKEQLIRKAKSLQSELEKVNNANSLHNQFIAEKSNDKITLEALKHEEDKFRSITHNISVGIYRSTADGSDKFIEFNRAFMRMFGYKTKSELFNKPVSSVYFNPEDRINLIASVQKKGFVRNVEISLLKKNGKTFTASVSTVLIWDKDGYPQFYDGIVEDISNRIAAQYALKNSENKYRTLFKFSPNGILIEDNSGTIVDVNPAFCRLMGYRPSELIGQKVHILAYPGTGKEVDANIKKLNSGNLLKHVVKSVKKNGSLVMMKLNESSFTLPDGTPGIICIAEDITRRITAEDNLQKSEVSYHGLFNNATDAIYILDSEGKFVNVNKGAEKMHGYSRKEFIGKSPEFVSPPRLNDMEEITGRFIKAFKGQPQQFEFWGIDIKGRIFPNEVRLNKSIYFGREVVIAFAQDITRRKTAQKILQESEQKFRRIYNAFPDIYFRASMNGVIEEISPSLTKITGFKQEKVIGKSSKEFYYNLRDWMDIGSLLAANEKIYDFDTKIRTKKNGFINCSLIAGLVYDQFSRPVAIEGVLRDITERKKGEEALRESQRRLSTLMGNLPGMAYRCLNDNSWTMEFVSDGCLEITGYKPSDLTGNHKISYQKIIHPDDRQMVWNKVQEAISSRTAFRLTYRIITRNGQEKWVWEQGLGVFSPDGKLIALEGFITNITEQKLAEEEIRKFVRVAEQSPTMIIITDLKGNIEYVNPKFEKVSGYSAKEVYGQNPRILNSGFTPKKTYLTLWKNIIDGKEWTGEFFNKKKNGELYWESASISPLKDETERITHFIAIKEDITNRKNMEQELIRAKNKAEESDKLKSAFLANMSHEIRTPMNAILGFSQLLSDPETTNQERDHYLDLIQKSGVDLMALIDDIIDISKIEAGQMKVYKSPCYVNQIMVDLYESYLEFIRKNETKRNLELLYQKPANAEIIVLNTDMDRLKQVFKNLLNNALKFTDNGRIEFGFILNPQNHSRLIRFYVNDTGIGISKDKLGIIFESFRQANSSDSKLYGGTGLGLAITKKIIEILGGNIRVKSSPGKGSFFYFDLPNEQGLANEHLFSKKTFSPDKKYNWNDFNILIVEDDDQSYKFYQSVLKKTNAKIIRASTGEEAVTLSKKEAFNLVLMDIKLPGTDGYTVTKILKQINPELKIIAQTAFALSGERERCLKMGCVDYITKPISVPEFLRVIERTIEL